MIGIDLEATDTNPQVARIIQFAIKDTETGELYTSLVNPIVHIPDEVVELTGITDEIVADAPRFIDVAQSIFEMVDGRKTLIGYNVLGYDWPLLAAEFERVDMFPEWGHVIDTIAIFKRHRPTKLADAYKHYTGEELAGAHDAEVDIDATLRVFEEQKKFEATIAGMTEKDLAELSAYDRIPVDPAGHLRLLRGVVVFNARKVRDVPVANDPGFANWMLRGDFPESTKRIIRRLLQERRP